MWRRLGEVVPALAASPGVRVIVLRGAGGFFSAGADLRDVLEATRIRRAAESYCHQVVGALLAIAEFNGADGGSPRRPGGGGGVEIAMAADNRIATDNTSFQLPFARLGVVPDAFTLYRLRALIGESAAPVDGAAAAGPSAPGTPLGWA